MRNNQDKCGRALFKFSAESVADVQSALGSFTGTSDDSSGFRAKT